MDRRQWIKYLIVLFFLLMAIPLTDYQIRSRWIEKGFPGIAPIPGVSTTERDSVRSIPGKTYVEKKVIREKLSGTVKILPPKIQEPVLEFTAAMHVRHPDNLQQEMRALAEQNRGELKVVYRFHISPEEYQAKAVDFILPAGMVALGLIAGQTKYRDFIPVDRPEGKRVVTYFDDVLQYMIPPSLFVFDAIGEEKHHPVDQFFLMAISSGLSALQVRNLKSYLKEERPDGGTNSFPSGHTAVAFVGAQMIYKEFKDSNSLIAYSGYAMAGAVGIFRMVNNRHWASDVVAGAGISMLSTELAYWMYFPLRNRIVGEMNNAFGKYFIVMPVLQPDAVGFQMNIRF